jgi:hypothetical protein
VTSSVWLAEDEPGGEGVGVHEGGFHARALAADLAEDLVEERHGLGARSRRLR